MDAHPDFSRPKDCSNEHAMVLGNLMGDGAPDFADMVKHPFRKEDIIYVGLVADHMETWEEEYQKEYQMKYLTQQLAENSEELLSWIRENEYQQVLIHWDLDVLSPDDFWFPALRRAAYPSSQLRGRADDSGSDDKNHQRCVRNRKCCRSWNYRIPSVGYDAVPEKAE